MRKVTFGNPVLKVEGLEVKFDVVPVSSSLAILIGDKDLAAIVQQLYYWGLQGYGEVIDGVRWIYKPIKEWIEEVFPTLTPWKLGKMMKELVEQGIVRREKLFTKHHIQKGDRFWWQPKNQTYYYSLNTEKIQELADNYQTTGNTAKSPETSVFIKTQILSNEEIQDTKFSDCTKNRSNITSIENSSKEQSHPTLPCECEVLKPTSQEEEQFSNPELPLNQEERNKVSYKVIEQDIISDDVEQNINKYINTNEQVVQEDVRVAPEIKPIVKPKTPKGTKSKRKNQAPWKDEGQFKRFYRALIQALPIVANAHSPQGLAQTIIRQLRSGIPHSYWDDFKAGLPIGTSTKPEWEIEPGVPYPQFIEYLTEKLKAGNNTTTDEATRNEVFRILSKPRQAKAFWGQFKRSVVNVSEQIERDRALGVSNPNTPVWTRERIEPSIEEAATAGQKIMAVNSTAQTAIEAATNPQLEDIESLPNRSSAPDPWINESGEESPPTMRELLEERLGDQCKL
ncbi:MAG: hypothetical protein SWZ49_23630, partial [Cyanobacteriota bacterium]|nr:hypothetical protein [Cyanobacteriota bacterium]